jgi:hypothetical protein
MAMAESKTQRGPAAKRRKAPKKRAASATRKRGTATKATKATKAKKAAPAATRKRSAAAKAAPATGKRRATKARKRTRKAVVDRTATLTEELIESLDAGQRSAIQSVRKFVDTVERALPPRGNGSSKRQEVVDSAMEMADRLVHTQYDFLRSVVHSAAKTLGAAEKKNKK